MIFWSIIWIFGFLAVALCILLEYVNGTNTLRFWFCAFGIFALILSAIFVIGGYKYSKEFYNEFTAYQEKIETAELDQSQEYAILGKVWSYNNKLLAYQDELKKYSIFCPVYRKIKNLNIIELQYFDSTWGSD